MNSLQTQCLLHFARYIDNSWGAFGTQMKWTGLNGTSKSQVGGWNLDSLVIYPTCLISLILVLPILLGRKNAFLSHFGVSCSNTVCTINGTTSSCSVPSFPVYQTHPDNQNSHNLSSWTYWSIFWSSSAKLQHFLKYWSTQNFTRKQWRSSLAWITPMEIVHCVYLLWLMRVHLIMLYHLWN